MPSDGKIGRLLLNHQLFPPKYIPESTDVVVVSDSMWLIDEKPFNKLTLVHRILSANLYADENDYHRTSGFLGNTHPLEDALKHLKGRKVKTVKLFDPLDKPLLQTVERLVKRHKMALEVEDTPAFTETHEDLNQFLKEHPPKEKGGIRKYSHSTFYEWQRKRLKILWTSSDKPVGGKLSFDVENREPFTPKMDKDPTVYKPGAGAGAKLKEQIEKVAEYVESKYPKNPGILFRKSSSDSGSNDLVERLTMYPLTNAEAKKRLSIFLKKMLPNFGKYEDAFQPGVSFGYHSVLSSSLNNGLLTPGDVLEAVQSLPGNTTRKHLASLEGFVRQVFGWRAYCRLVYRQERQVMMRSNFLGHTRRLPGTWFRYSGDDGKGDKSLTNIEWLDNLLLDAQERAYAHHIVRLMVFSNWFLLNQYHPQDVLKWFWSVVSIDAYEWVMVPNVLGMGQYADGGIMMMRPYVSAGAYLETMSGGKVKDEDGIWTALYYGFLMKHQKTIGKMYAYARSMAYIRRSSPSKQREWKAIVTKYWKSLGKKYIQSKSDTDKQDDSDVEGDDVSKNDDD